MESFGSPRDARAGDIDPAQLAAVRTLARAALDARADGPAIAAAVLAEQGDVRLWQAVQRHRLVELVHQSGLLPDSPLARALAEDAEARRASVARHAELTGTVLAHLTAHGVRVLVIKGLPLAVQSTGDPHSRVSNDIDLWVDPRRLTEAVHALREAGWAYRPEGWFPPPDATAAWAWTRRTQRELQLRRDDVSVDVHVRLAVATGQLPPFDTAWRCRQTVVTPWGALPALRIDHAFAHTCLHAATDDWRSLRSLVDVRRLAERLAPDRVARLASTLSAVRRTLLVTEHSIGLGGGAAPPPALVDRGLAGVSDRSQSGPGRIHRPDSGRERLAVLGRQSLLGGTGEDYLLWAARTALPARLIADLGTAPASRVAAVGLRRRLTRGEG